MHTRDFERYQLALQDFSVSVAQIKLLLFYSAYNRIRILTI